jgi:predicted PurR-regulated permease PerM
MADSATNSESWTPRKTARGTLVVLGVLAGCGLVFLFRDILFLLFIAIVLATAISPLIALLQRQGLSRSASVVCWYILFLGLLLVGLVVAVPLAIEQLQSLAEAVPKSYQAVRDWLMNNTRPSIARLAERLPETIESVYRSIEVTDVPGKVEQAVSYSGQVVWGLFCTMAVLVLAFYWSVNEQRTIRELLLCVPMDWREELRELLEAMLAKVGGYIRAQGILCGMVGLLSLIAFWIIGLPYAFTLAVLAGLLEAVPVFGPILGAIPAIIAALSSDPGQVVWVIVAAVVIQQIENYLLVPRVMDHAVGVHPVTTLLALAAFTGLLGILGAILAIPMAAIVQLVLERFVLNRETHEPDRPEGRDSISVLRYQARELARDVRLQLRQKAETLTSRSDRLEEGIEAIAGDLDRWLAEGDDAEKGSAPPV